MTAQLTLDAVGRGDDPMTTTDTTITTCECCGTPVRRVSDDEGTQGYGPVYLLFAGDDYYPDGGVGDYRGMHTTLEAAQAAAEALGTSNDADWAEIATLTGDGLRVVMFANYLSSGEVVRWQ